MNKNITTPQDFWSSVCVGFSVCENISNVCCFVSMCGLFTQGGLLLTEFPAKNLAARSRGLCAKKICSNLQEGPALQTSWQQSHT
jgi:hypothetical protein